jgi:phage N-6-adenine-methyltransferase
MSLVGFKAQNHPQQVQERDALDPIDDRATPLDWFRELDARFGGFTLDVAASFENRKCDRFINYAGNGLAQPWTGERVWCNPPFSNLGEWVEKAWWEFRHGCPLIVMVLPANRTEQGWWQDYLEPHRDKPGSPVRVEFVRGRKRFIAAGEASVKSNERPPFGVCLVIWQMPDVGRMHPAIVKPVDVRLPLGSAS